MAGGGITTAASTVWIKWCVGTSTATDSTATAGDTWNYWNGSTATSSATASTVWVEWNTSDSRPRPETPEQRERREAANREYEERRKKEREEAAAAEQRAKDLLVANLDEQQREQYAKERKFGIVTAEGERYEIDCTKRMHNVFELDAEGKRLREYCIYQSGNTPLPDNHLAQKLLLEANPREFKRIANMTQLRRQA